MSREGPGADIRPMDDRYRGYLSDESRMMGKADSISFPRDARDVAALVRQTISRGIPVTVQGARTGITGGAVPRGGHVLNLSRMNRMTGLERADDGGFLITVEPGVTLEELDERLAERRFDTTGWDPDGMKALEALLRSPRQFWPPDPSERTASLGGIAAHNSRGICARFYGAAADHITALEGVDSTGEIHRFVRTMNRVPGTLSSAEAAEIRQDDSAEGSLVPEPTDLYLGAEGMLGVMTRLTLRLQPVTDQWWGIVCFFAKQASAVRFISSIETISNDAFTTDIVSIEFMDRMTLECVREQQRFVPSPDPFPDWGGSTDAAVCIEIRGNSAEGAESLLEKMMEEMSRAGGDTDQTWAFSGEVEMRRFRRFRHAAPEAVNGCIDRKRIQETGILKLGTDMSCPGHDLGALLEMYQAELHESGLAGAVFGHAADRHLHVNILSQNLAGFDRGRRLIRRWAGTVSREGGSVITEHGMGKNKGFCFQDLPLPARYQALEKIKAVQDPGHLWNPGNGPGSYGGLPTH